MSDGVLVGEVRVRGPLALYAAGFAAYLAGQGYTPGSAHLQVQLVSQLSRWLDAEGLGVDGLSELAAGRFMAARRARVERLFRSRRALDPLIAYLRGLGVAPAPAAAVLSPVDELIDRYRRYLLVERALTPGTATVYVTAVRPFLAGFESAERLELERLAGADVSAFVLTEARRRPGTSIRSVATALRSLLGFLHVQGLTPGSLTVAVPGVGAWRQAGLPRPLERGELRRLLASCDRRTTVVGRRDFAMLLLMGRLGLRCGEVAGLMLEDVDWRAGELIVYGKGRRDDRLPLPVDVGRALTAYLRRGRPASALDRSVFVRTLAPHRRPGPVDCAPAAAHRRDRAAARGRDPARGWAGAPSPPRVQHRDLRQGRRRGAAPPRPPLAGGPLMSPLRQQLEDYLQIRRALGFKLISEGRLLDSFVAYMESAGAETVTISHALRWAVLPSAAKPVYHAKRLRAVRGFARYLHTLDPAHELLATDLLGSGGWRRPAPYIYTPQEIVALMAAAGRLKSRLGAATMRTLIGLLAVTGMRVGEAIRLDRDDLDLHHGRLIVRNSKFGKSRQLPLHPTTITALREYLATRDLLKPQPQTPALLIGTWGNRLTRDVAESTFRLLRQRVGLQARPGSAPPRMHDLRHSFAVHTMLDAYRSGGEPTACASDLATYLGHADPGASYWYLSAAPELLALAAARLEAHQSEAAR